MRKYGGGKSAELQHWRVLEEQMLVHQQMTVAAFGMQARVSGGLGSSLMCVY